MFNNYIHKINTFFNNKDNNDNLADLSCFHCSQKINYQRNTFCIRCNIILHDTCWKNHYDNGLYCICPNCRKIGTLGTTTP